MKKILSNGAPLVTDEEGNSVLAARIEQSGDSIIGYDADEVEVFAIRGINPTVSVEIKDESGVDAAFDKSPDDDFRAAIQAASTLAELKDALLGTSGPGAEPRRKR